MERLRKLHAFRRTLPAKMFSQMPEDLARAQESQEEEEQKQQDEQHHAASRKQLQESRVMPLRRLAEGAYARVPAG